MFRRPILAALAAGIAADDDDVARTALRRYDPVLRGFAKRKLERALIDAALLTDGAPAPAHVMRLAALAIAGRATETTEEGAVEAAYRELPRPAMPRAPIVTILATLVTAVGITFGTVYALHAMAKKSRLYARPLPPPAAGAFRDGGVPLRDPQIDKLLDDGITELVADTGRAQASGGTITPIVDKLRVPAAITAHGDALAKAWAAMLAAYERAAVPTGNETRDEEAATAIREAARAVTDQFASAGLGYFIEGRVRNRQPILQTYRVEEIVFVMAADQPRRVLSLRRIDHLNLSWALLGMHSEELGDPVVLLDQIDANVASTVLPVLVPTAPYELADDEWLATPTGAALAKQTGDVVRRELAAALGADAATAGKIAALLVERKRITDDWREHLEDRGLTMADIRDLYLPEHLLEQLGDLVPHSQHERVEAIEDELTELEAPRIASSVQQLITATVRRHEAQHGFDADRAHALRYPDPLRAMLGPAETDDGREVPIVRSARAELSAYLSQIINDPVTPHFALWNLARQVFTEDQQGTGESFAAVVVIEGLAKQLGMPIGEGYAMDRERLAPLAARIATLPDADLRATAARVWTDLYGEPPTWIVDAPGAVKTAAN